MMDNLSATTDTILTTLGINIGTVALTNVVSAAVILIICLIVVKALCSFTAKVLEKSRLDKLLHTFILSAMKAILYVVTAIIVATSLGIEASSLVALLSVAGLAASLAMQNSLSNLAGGIMLLITKPFQVGDFVETAGGTGTIAEIGLAYTKINSVDNKVVLVPNSTVSSANIVNYSAEGKRRVDVNFSVSYDNETETVKKALMETIGRCDKITSEPEEPFVRITSYNDSTITYTVRVWCLNDDYWDVYFHLMEDARESFKKNNVAFTYSHLNVHVVEK